MPLALVRGEPERFPECFAAGGGIRGEDPAGRGCSVEQCKRQLTGDATAPESGPHIKAPHAECAGGYWLNSDTADSGQNVIRIASYQGFARAIEPLFASIPIRLATPSSLPKTPRVAGS